MNVETDAVLVVVCILTRLITIANYVRAEHHPHRDDYWCFSDSVSLVFRL